MKKVKLLTEIDGGKYAFCPYCNEFAYEKDHCVFCGKKYKWIDRGRKEMTVAVGEYIVTQTSNNHITITKGGNVVYHAQCDRRQSKRAMKKGVAFYESLLSERSGE